jgi:hypothetical protein
VAPEIVGGRPIDYTTPPNEVTRSRQFLDRAQGRAQPVFTPAPGAAYPTLIPGPSGVAAAPVITSPPAYAPYTPTPVIASPPASTASPSIKYRY